MYTGAFGIRVSLFGSLLLLLDIMKWKRGNNFMSKIAVVYWSGTGNTESMANKVADGAKRAGAEVSLFTASEFQANMMDQFDAIAFGCPSMGAEQLEESEFEPMFNECEAKLQGKKIALFGSYGWGDGEWLWRATV